jgi:methyl-accepting chemotaxis protein
MLGGLKMKSIKTKLMVSFSTLIFVVILVMGLVFLKTSYSSLQDEAEKSLGLMAAEGAKLTESRMDTLITSLEIIAQKQEIEDMGWDVDLRTLKEELSKTSFLDIGYVLANGYSYYSDGTVSLMSDRSYIKAGLNGKASMSDVIISRVTRQPEIEICVPVKKDGEVVGALVARSEANTLSLLTQDEGYGDDGYAFMINTEGRIIAYPDIEMVTKLYNPIKEATKDSKLTEMSVAFQYMLDEEAGVTSFSKDDKSYFAGFAPIEGTNWIFATTADKQEVFSVIPGMLRTILIVMILVILAGIGVVLLLEQTITRPLTGITKLSKQYANLDFREIISEKYLQQKDEVGVLSHAFKSLTLQLKEIISNINESAGHVAASAQELTAASEQSAKISEDISCAIDNIAQGASEQAANTEIGSENAALLGELIEKNQEYVNHLNSTSEQVNELVNSGLSDVDRLSISAKDNRDATEDICEIIMQTKKSSEQIGEASKVISEMANQTTLLALNASIEAARAGEAGRGFSVVAQEIQKMADQSAASTSHIDKIIKTLLQNVMKSTISIERIKSTSQEQQKSVTETIQKYRAIADSMQISKEAVQKLNASENDMEGAKNEILHMLQSLSAIAEQNAAGTQQAASFSEEQTAAAKTLSETSGKLTELAINLQTLIDRVKV